MSTISFHPLVEGLLRSGDSPESFEPAAFLRESRERISRFQLGTDSSGSRITRLYTAAVDNTLRRVDSRRFT